MQYERLTKWEDKNIASVNGSSPIYKDFATAINRLADLEDKIENGTLVELPCKVGQKIYQINAHKIERIIVSEIHINKSGIYLYEGEGWCPLLICGEYFLNKQLAEKALEEKQIKEWKRELCGK